jgi:hypothetical protein
MSKVRIGSPSSLVLNNSLVAAGGSFNGTEKLKSVELLTQNGWMVNYVLLSRCLFKKVSNGLKMFSSM